MDTPEFLVWAIEFNCPVRGFQNGSDPERTERQLRTARAVSDARRENRIFAGFAVNPPRAFRIEDSLRIYGGSCVVHHACSDCPANASARIDPAAWAGCCGILPTSPELHHAIDAALEVVGTPPLTNRRWYGFWLNSPLPPEQAAHVGNILAPASVPQHSSMAFEQLLAGLNTAAQQNLPFHAVAFPSGRVAGTSWLLDPHCSRCKAPWNQPSPASCPVCHYHGHPAPDKKRKARGQRPYFPLDRLLGTSAAEAFLTRYYVHQTQTQPRSADRPQTPSPARPPNNPPAD